MANKHSNLASLFSDIAAAIREKTSGVGTIVADDFPNAIAAISGGGGSNGFWIESGSVPSDTSNEMLFARIALSNPDHISSMLGCSAFFTNEGGDLCNAHCAIFATNPGQHLGTQDDYSATEGTVVIQSGDIHWTSSEFKKTQSSAVVHYIAYGINW